MKAILYILLFVVSSNTVYAQSVDSISKGENKKSITIKPLKFSLNEDGSHYVQFMGLVQVWTRYNQNNPNNSHETTPSIRISSRFLLPPYQC